jgi:HNH endonuclease
MVDGSQSHGHESAEEAIEWIEAHDKQFWEIGVWWSGGTYSGLGISCGYLDSTHTDHLVRCSLPEEPVFPKHLMAPFKKHFLTVAKCARCGGQSSKIFLGSLEAFLGTKRRLISHIVCSCGYPVWRISSEECDKATDAFALAERRIERKLQLTEAGGKHSLREIQEILNYQKNRCFYCNVPFNNEIRSTKDHILPVYLGGGDWALNIVMACRPCNSRRSCTPFRMFCRLLSPAQNRRILRSLALRIAAVRPEERLGDAFMTFCVGLAWRGWIHWRTKPYSLSAKARRYAAVNKLLPSDPDLILRRANLL